MTLPLTPKPKRRVTSAFRSRRSGRGSVVMPYTRAGVARQFKALIKPAWARLLVLSFLKLVEAYVLTPIRRKRQIG